MTLRITVLAIASASICLRFIGCPAIAQAPSEPSAPGIIQPGDEVTVRCFTHEKLHVYCQGNVWIDGTLLLPDLGVVPMAGRGLQMVRDELQRRYRDIYPQCSVNLSVQRPEPEEEEVEEEEEAPEPTATPMRPLTAPPSREDANRVIRAGDQLMVRCSTGGDVHVDVPASVSNQGTISPPHIPELYVAGLRIEELQRTLHANYRPLFPGCSVQVRRISEALEPIRPPVEEMVAPTVEVTAAARFAALPRFGLDVFAAAERPEAQTTTAEPDEQDQPAVTQAVPPSYILGPGDEVAVRVWTDAIEHINAVMVIDADGKIYLDLLGEVTITGQRLSEVRDNLAQRYRRFFDRANVSVGLARTRVIEVRVTGDARRPGKHVLSGAATVFSALYAAGGPSDVGALRGIKLVRTAHEPMTIDLYDYLLEGNESGDVPLEPQDTIFVPPVQAMVGVTGQVRRPGRYELDGHTTLAQALEMAAGLAPTGYAHNVQVWRVTEHSQRQVLNINLEGEGREGADSSLQDGDLILVHRVLEDPDNVVELAGAVQRPGSYQVLDGMTVRDLINTAQGLDDTAHTETAQLWRLNDELDYELVNFDLTAAMKGDAAHNLSIKTRDRVIILSEEKVEPPMEVEVKGAVLYPSIVPWTKGMRVSDLLLQAGGVAEDAYLQRAPLLRLGDDQRRELISLDLAAALTEDEGADLILERGDILTVFARSEVVPPSEVQVSGFVQNPGTYARPQQMRVSDAVLAAGGLAATAGDEIEYTPGGVQGEVTPQYLRVQRLADGFAVQPDPVLGDNDHVAMLGSGELITQPPIVTIKGRVARPGTYALQQTANNPDTIYKLLQRAGPILPDANPNGIVLYRLREAIIAEEQEDDLSQLIMTFNRELSGQTVEGEEQRAGGMLSTVTAGLSAALSEGGSAVVVPPRRLSATAWARAVPIEGAVLIENKGERQDFPLMNGDVIVVPPMPKTVTVMGAVVRPGAVPYAPEYTPLYYIQESGGTTPDARMGRLVIIRANGRVEPRAFQAKVRPGDVILVPSDYIFRRVNKPTTLDRLLSAISAVLTGYLIFD